MSEKDVFIQNVSEEEMEAVAGGEGKNSDGCENCYSRDIYAGGFPNCAATVDAGSHCFSNDGCEMASVVYYNMNRCNMAWE